ncbi:helix-turn-helix transcriptional regulator [Lentilitoribacter sp. EG35]|uniref:helix-turn-helix transcriptional regulator n=1 Tax=Lentilitoribacter sp. EG35 TaxID=3234192 RepID=UPI0034608D9F
MREPALLIFAVALQIIGCLFFVVPIIFGFFGISLRPAPWQIYEIMELISALALVIGLIMSLRLFNRSRVERDHAKLALKRASSAFGEVLEERFHEWQLSAAERDVAMFLIKGSSTAEIADMRNTSEGTIKAQNAAIYKKAGVTGKTQLLSLFVEDLFEKNEQD